MGSTESHSTAETEAHGETWGRRASRGWVVGLSGDLGAGKTAWVRGFARGLGVTQRVHSPTYALINEYVGGRCPLFHLDLYRLPDREAIEAAGLGQVLQSPEGVAVVEWIERWLSPLEHEGMRIHGDAVQTIPATTPLTLWVRIESPDENRRILWTIEK